MKQAYEDLQKSMKSMKVDDGKAETLQELIGYDIDMQHQRQPISYQVSQSTSEISLGGLQEITSGNLQISLRDENVIYYLDRCCVAFTLKLYTHSTVGVGQIPWLDGGVINLFNPINASLGQLQWSVADGQYYLHAKQNTTHKDKYSKIAHGMLLDLGKTQYNYFTPAADIFQATVGASVASNAIAKYSLDKMAYMVSISDQRTEAAADVQGFKTFRVVVPLSKIWPFVSKSFYQDSVYVGMGQQLVLNSQLAPAAQALCLPYYNTASKNPFYSISNAQLIKVYTQLESPSVSQILRSSLPILKREVLLVKQPLQASVVLNYNINEKQRAKYLYISYHYNVQHPSTIADVTVPGENTLANVYEAQAQPYKKASYCPAIAKCISLLQISFGGETRTFNMQQLQSLFQSGVIFGQEEFYEDDWIARAMHSTLRLDIRRMCPDLLGSSSGNNVSIQVQIIHTNGIVIPGASVFDFGTMGPRFTVETFLECVSSCELANGIYKVI